MPFTEIFFIAYSRQLFFSRQSPRNVGRKINMAMTLPTENTPLYVINFCAGQNNYTLDDLFGQKQKSQKIMFIYLVYIIVFVAVAHTQTE